MQLTPIIDSHCHYNLSPLFENNVFYSQEAQKNGVVGAIIPGIDEKSSLIGAKLAKNSQYFACTIGIHPTEAGLRNKPINLNDLLALYDEAKAFSQPVAIGETGLDYYHLPDSDSRNKQIEHQKQSFLEHLKLAQLKKIPIILHVRDRNDTAYLDILQIIQDANFTQSIILHCVSGPINYLKTALNLGFYLSLAGNCTYPKSPITDWVIKNAPTSQLLIETDAPYLPTQAHRGQVCEPAFIKETATFLAEGGHELSEILKNTVTLFPHFSYLEETSII